MCALECPEYFAEMRDLGKVNGWDTYEVRVVRRPCTADLDDDQRPLTPLVVLAGPVRIRGVYLPRIQKRARRWLRREGWRMTGSWDWDGDDWLFWTDVVRKCRIRRRLRSSPGRRRRIDVDEEMRGR
jgi:hypothetical protein